MALNFPIPTSVGQVYQDPTSGNTYVCTSLGPPAQWVGSGSSTSLDSTYLRTDASNDPVTGNLLLNPTSNVSPLTLQQPVGNTTPALKIENSGSGNSIEANGGFALSNTGVLTLGTALAIASGGTGATTQSAARTNLGATTVGNAVFTAVDEAAGRLAIGAMANTAPEIIPNANGTAYRWPNGLQICTTTINLNYMDATTFEAVWTYPATFTTGSVPHCFLSPPVTAQGGSINGPLWNTVTNDYRKVSVFGANHPTNPHLSAILRIWSVVGQTFSTGYISGQAVAIGTYTP